MAYRRRARRTKKRSMYRSYRKRKTAARRYSKRTTRTRRGQRESLGQGKMIYMPYTLTETNTIIAAADAGYEWVFNCNSITDVDVNAVGNQRPVGFNEWTALYQKYQVPSFKASIDLRNGGTLHSDWYLWFADQPNALASTAANKSAFEQLVVRFRGKKVSLGDGNKNEERITMQMSQAHMFAGLNMADAQFIGYAASSPPTAYYLNIVMLNPDNAYAAAVNNLSCVMSLVYAVKLFDPVGTIPMIGNANPNLAGPWYSGWEKTAGQVALGALMYAGGGGK